MSHWGLETLQALLKLWIVHHIHLIKWYTSPTKVNEGAVNLLKRKLGSHACNCLLEFFKSDKRIEHWKLPNELLWFPSKSLGELFFSQFFMRVIIGQRIPWISHEPHYDCLKVNLSCWVKHYFICFVLIWQSFYQKPRKLDRLNVHHPQTLDKKRWQINKTDHPIGMVPLSKQELLNLLKDHPLDLLEPGKTIQANLDRWVLKFDVPLVKRLEALLLLRHYEVGHVVHDRFPITLLVD